MRKYKNLELGELVAKGKTKEIHAIIGKSHWVMVSQKDTITADDGKKKDVFPGKGVLANETTCNVFDMLKRKNLPLAYVGRYGVASFLAQRCTMLPYKVVVRNEAYGSYCKRNPDIEEGTRLQKKVVEFFLKTTDKECGRRSFITDDPLIRFAPQKRTLELFLRDTPAEEPFDEVPFSSLIQRDETWEVFAEMSMIARQVFLILEPEWARIGGRLIDYKVEFGISPQGVLMLADVIDNDSWRVILDNERLDTKVYRDGGQLDVVRQRCQQVATLTRSFLSPSQRIG